MKKFLLSIAVIAAMAWICGGCSKAHIPVSKWVNSTAAVKKFCGGSVTIYTGEQITTAPTVAADGKTMIPGETTDVVKKFGINGKLNDPDVNLYFIDFASYTPGTPCTPGSATAQDQTAILVELQKLNPKATVAELIPMIATYKPAAQCFPLTEKIAGVDAAIKDDNKDDKEDGVYSVHDVPKMDAWFTEMVKTVLPEKKTTIEDCITDGDDTDYGDCKLIKDGSFYCSARTTCGSMKVYFYLIFGFRVDPTTKLVKCPDPKDIIEELGGVVAPVNPVIIKDPGIKNPVIKNPGTIKDPVIKEPNVRI